MPFFVKAAVAGLRSFPTLNASLGRNERHLAQEIKSASPWRSTGACSSRGEKRDEKNILGIHGNMNDLAERARSKKLKPEEVQESTFSHHQPRRLSAACSGLPGDQPAERRHPWSRRYREATGGHQRLDRHPFDVLRGRSATTIAWWRRDRPPIPAQGEGNAGKLVGPVLVKRALLRGSSK